MIRQVAEEFNATFNENAIRTHFTGVFGSIILGNIPATALVGFVPIFGWAVKSAVLTVVVRRVGDAAIDYFAERSPLPDEQTTIGEEHGTFADEP